MANQVERLTLIFDANFTKLQDTVTKSALMMDQRLGQMEKRAVASQSRLQSTFGKMGSTLLAGASLVGIEQFVVRTTASVEAIEKQSKVLGLSTDTFQEWSLIARKGGADTEAWSAGMDRFAKNIGQAQSGTGEFKKVLDQLHVSAKGTVEDVFYRFIDASQKLNTTQRDYAMSLGFGRGYQQMAGFIDQSSDAIRRQAVELKANGEVIDSEQIAKIHAFEKAWIDVKAQFSVAGVNILSGFADAVHNMTGDFKDEKFQTALKAFGSFLGTLAGFLAKNADNLGILAAIYGGAKLGRLAGPEGAFVGGAAGGIFAAAATTPEATQRANVAKTERFFPDWYRDTIGYLTGTNLSPAAPPAPAPKRNPLMSYPGDTSQLPQHAPTAHLDLGNHGDAARALRQHGQAALDAEKRAYEVNVASIKSLQELYKAAEQYTRGIGEKTAAQKLDTATLGMSTDEAERYKVSTEAEAVAAALDARGHADLAQKVRDAAAAYVSASTAHEAAAEEMQKSVAVTDELRDGLENAAAAGLGGFKSLKSAAADFLMTLAQMILKLYVMQPLMESLLGKPGTVGGGSLGGLLGDVLDIPKFASGTNYAPGGAALIGEHGPELVRLSPGSRVVPTSQLGAALGARSVGMTVHMGSTSIVVQGRADDGVVDRMHAELDARDQHILASVNAAFPKKLSDTLRDRG